MKPSVLTPNASLAPDGAPEKSGGGRSTARPKAVPDFSPEMLKLFMHARTFDRAMRGDGNFKAARLTICREIAKLAKLPVITAALAFDGRLRKVEPRAAIWAVLHHFPHDHGVTLTNGGQDA